jgi:hypothetical protein
MYCVKPRCTFSFISDFWALFLGEKVWLGHEFGLSDVRACLGHISSFVMLSSLSSTDLV